MHRVSRLQSWSHRIGNDVKIIRLELVLHLTSADHTPGTQLALPGTCEGCKQEAAKTELIE